MFGAKLIMFCSPQPYGIWIRESRPLMDGPRMSPVGERTDLRSVSRDKVPRVDLNVTSVWVDELP